MWQIVEGRLQRSDLFAKTVLSLMSVFETFVSVFHALIKSAVY